MGGTLSPEVIEAMVISGPDRGRIIEIPRAATEQLVERDLALVNEALD